MKISNPLILVFALTFGLSLTAEASKRSSRKLKKTYKLQNCDCIAEREGIPAFLSDHSSYDVEVSAYGKTMAEAEKKANKICTRKFRWVKKAYAAGAVASGCRKKVNIKGLDRWKEI